MSRDTPQFPLRMPDDLRSKVKARADAEHRSLNAQIVAMLERGLAAEKAASNHTA